MWGLELTVKPCKVKNGLSYSLLSKTCLFYHSINKQLQFCNLFNGPASHLFKFYELIFGVLWVESCLMKIW